jgi:small subunit ribosomal protein S4
VKLFLKGEKCSSPKCILIKRPYPPGIKGKRTGHRGISEYGKELREKQKLRNWYNLSEKQLQKYVREVIRKGAGGEDAAALLIRKLESRLDNVVFRLGFAASRAQARQMVSHGHFLVNNQPVNIPSYEIKKDDKISLRPRSIKKPAFKDLETRLKKYQPPSWLELNQKDREGKVKNLPALEDAIPPAEISAVFEFYSR